MNSFDFGLSKRNFSANSGLLSLILSLLCSLTFLSPDSLGDDTPNSKTTQATSRRVTSGPLRFDEHLIMGNYGYPYGIAAADLDGDGDLDLTSSDAVAKNCLYWFENTGNGGFQRHLIQVDDPGLFERHQVGDIDRDGHPDIVIVKNRSGDVLWFQNNGTPKDGKLWKRHVITSKKLVGAYDVALADFDSDGDLDVAASSWRIGNNFVWFENDGTPADGEWKTRIIDENINETRAILVADVDGDNDPDLVGTGSGAKLIVWYENDGQPASRGWTKHVIDNQSSRPMHGQTVDIDKDGDLDVLMALGMGGTAADKGQIAWYENPGKAKTQHWKKHVILEPLPSAFEAVTGDLDADGDLDVIATAWGTSGQVIWLENHGNPKGKWSMHVIKNNWPRANQVIVADIDGDGKLDLAACAERNTLEFRWWRNLGTTRK